MLYEDTPGLGISHEEPLITIRPTAIKFSTLNRHVVLLLALRMPQRSASKRLAKVICHVVAPLSEFEHLPVKYRMLFASLGDLAQSLGLLSERLDPFHWTLPLCGDLLGGLRFGDGLVGLLIRTMWQVITACYADRLSSFAPVVAGADLFSAHSAIQS